MCITRKETDNMKRKIAYLIGIILLCACITCACKEEILLQEVSEEYVPNDVADMATGNGMQMLTDTAEAMSPEVICVHVCGAVKEPGVYELKEGERINDAVQLAGGFDEEADRDAVNLVSVVSDGEQIRIPFIGECMSASDGGLININDADEDALCQIPGIGESRAKAIVDYRREHGDFTNTEELMQVPGIKEGIDARIIPDIECR